MKFHSTALFVKNIEASKVFYTKYLNLSVKHDFGKNVILSDGITIWEINPNHIISQKLETQSPVNKFELYFEDENIDELHTTLERAGIKFLHEIHEELWGQRTIRFFDPDNHLIEVGEPLDVFVNNLSRSGLSPEQISAKSGIPEETVRTLLKK